MFACFLLTCLEDVHLHFNLEINPRPAEGYLLVVALPSPLSLLPYPSKPQQVLQEPVINLFLLNWRATTQNSVLNAELKG